MNWTVPEKWQQITAIDAHTGGEPLRIFTGGYPPLQGKTILEKRRYAKENLDHLRTATLWEPRGHADMYGCIITEPVTEDGDCGLIFTHNEGYSSMCGHGIIAVTKVALETGMIAKAESKKQLKIDTPAGRVTAYPHWKEGQVKEVSFHNVPSFVYALDQSVEVPGLGKVSYDLAFGGAFYAFVRADSVDVELTAAGFRRLIELGTTIKKAIMKNSSVIHPVEKDLSFLYGVIFVGQALDPRHHSRNVCVFADGEVDRSPTGTGVSARTALHHSRGELNPGESITIESIIGSCFKAEISELTKFESYEAVIPKVTGTAHICGINTLLLDPDDPLGSGFILR
ncbi:MAG: proline racemase family protein [Bacillota bacterium]